MQSLEMRTEKRKNSELILMTFQLIRLNDDELIDDFWYTWGLKQGL